MDDQSNSDNKNMVDKIMADLEWDKPSITEMVMEIKQVGLAIQLENTDISFLEKNKEEIITTMWKAVKVAKILKDKNINIEIDSPVRTVTKKQSIH